MEPTKVNIGPVKRDELDTIIRAAAKPHAVEAKLDSRYTSKPGVYGPYERYLLSSGHTLFLSLETWKATVSDKPSAIAVRKVKALETRKAERAARKAEREKKVADRKAAKEAAAKAPKPVREPKPKASRKPKVKADAKA